MRPSIKIALLFAGIWFTGKLLFFYGNLFQDEAGVKILVMWNILCLLLGMTIGIWMEKRGENRAQSTTLGDIKSSMAGGMVYTVIVATLIYVYYAKIDPGYNERQRAVAEESVRKLVNDPVELARVKKNNPDMASMTKEEIMDKGIQNQQAIFSAGSTMTLSLLGMVLLTTINAIILTIIFRRVLFKQRTI